MTKPPMCVCGHPISSHNLHGCFGDKASAGCGCFRPPQQVSIDAHLDGTGHTSLASLRREFDAMRAEVAAWRAFCDAAEDSSWPNAWADYAENLTCCEAATDAARPKEPT